MGTVFLKDLESSVDTDIHTVSSTGDLLALDQIIKSLVVSGKDLYLSINKRNEEGWTPLMYAAQNGNDPILYYLLDLGVLTFIQNRKGQDALMLAASYGHEKSVEILIEHGLDLNATDHKSWTPLFYAVSAGQHLVVRVLLRNKCHMNICDKWGMTPIMIAAACGHELIFEDLLDHGPHPDFFTPNGLLRLRDLALEHGYNGIVRLVDSFPKPYRVAGRIAETGITNSKTVQGLLDFLGLSKYYTFFKDNVVELDKFWLLTDKDLKDMGMSALGPRKKMLFIIERKKLWIVRTYHEVESHKSKVTAAILKRKEILLPKRMSKMSAESSEHSKISECFEI